MQSAEATPASQPVQNQISQKCLRENSSDYKRASSRNSQHSIYETVRKYNCHNLLNQDSAYTAKSSQNPEEDLDDPQQSIQQPELSVIEEQQSVVSSSVPIRERVGHLLPSYMAANYSLEHIKLIQTQIKLDELLDFVRLHRQKIKGEYLSNIKRAMEGTHFQTDHLKQILFLLPDFYLITEKKDSQGRQDILLALPDFTELETRKQQFRKKLFQYLTDNQGFSKNKNVKIPSYCFPFGNKQDTDKKQSLLADLKSKNSFFLQRQHELGRINPLDALKPGNTQKFAEQLNAKIKQNEKRIQAEKEKEAMIRFGSKQLLAVFDELPRIFKKREKSSMFKSSIIQDLDNTLNIKEPIICKILSVLIEKHSEFFKIIPHKSGQILQIQTKIYNELRPQIEKTVSSEMEEIKQNEQKQKIQQEEPIKQPEPRKQRNKSCPPANAKTKNKKIIEPKQVLKIIRRSK